MYGNQDSDFELVRTSYRVGVRMPRQSGAISLAQNILSVSQRSGEFFENQNWNIAETVTHISG
jgi:hypothetical protein